MSEGRKRPSVYCILFEYMNIFEYGNHKLKVIRNILTYTIVSCTHTSRKDSEHIIGLSYV